MVSSMIHSLVGICLLLSPTQAQWFDEQINEVELSDQYNSRQIYFNDTTTIAAVVVGIGFLILAVAVGLYLYDFAATERVDNQNYYTQPYSGQYNQYGYSGYTKRSADDGFGFNGVEIIAWLSMLREVYEKFDVNDIECQKKLICDVMQEQTFGEVSRRMKKGFEFAKYLEVLNFPDEMREVLDEMIDASEKADGQKECQEFFECPYSLKDSMKRNFPGNSLY